VRDHRHQPNLGQRKRPPLAGKHLRSLIQLLWDRAVASNVAAPRSVASTRHAPGRLDPRRPVSVAPGQFSLPRGVGRAQVTHTVCAHSTVDTVTRVLGLSAVPSSLSVLPPLPSPQTRSVRAMRVQLDRSDRTPVPGMRDGDRITMICKSIILARGLATRSGDDRAHVPSPSGAADVSPGRESGDGEPPQNSPSPGGATEGGHESTVVASILSPLRGSFMFWRSDPTASRPRPSVYTPNGTYRPPGHAERRDMPSAGTRLAANKRLPVSSPPAILASQKTPMRAAACSPQVLTVEANPPGNAVPPFQMRWPLW
jgi:hypothetical protein